MSMWEASEIVDNATQGVPEEILDMPVVERALSDIFQHLVALTDWIDPESDGYREELSEMEQQGAFAVAEYYRKSLEDALYRQNMFGTRFDLEGFLDGLHGVSVAEVLEEAR